MKKTLRYFFASALMLVCGSAMAEDIIWQENWTGYSADANPQGVNANYTFEGTVLNEDGSIKSGTKIYDANLAGGTAPELLVAKNGGSFSATVALNGKSGEMMLAYKTNRSDLKVEVTNATLGDKQRTGNDDQYTVTVAEGTTEITVKFSMTTGSNARLDDIKLYQGTAKKPAGLSWGKASTTLTIGEEVTLVLSNANNLPVAYSSSDEAVATISAEGAITLVAAGKTVLTAAFDGNDEYEAQSVSIEVTVKAADGENPNPNPNPEVTVISVAEALAVIDALDNSATTTDVYQVKGFVISVSEISTSYGNATFVIADAADATTGLTVFRVKGFDGKNITNAELIKVGDEVVVEGKLQKYVKNDVVTPEMAQGGKIISINGKTSDDAPQVDPNAKGQQNNPYLLSDADFLALAESLNTEGNPRSEQIYVKGYIVNIEEVSAQYGNATIKIAAVKGDYNAEIKLKVFRCKYLENQNFTAEDQIKLDDEVVLFGQLQWYGTDDTREPEFVSSYIYSLNGETKANINAINADLQQAPVYNLAGQRVQNAQKGLFIIGGKKVIK